MKKEDWWILGFVCFLFIDFFMIIGHFVFSTESGEISMSNALVVDQAHVLKRKDLKMVGKINQRKLQEQVSHPMARHREMNCYL